MKWADVVSNVELADGETHTVLLDPSLGLESAQGPSGEYWITMVVENGLAVELSMGKRLRNRIKDLQLTKKTSITIRRTGEGFQTDYEVSVA